MANDAKQQEFQNKYTQLCARLGDIQCKVNALQGAQNATLAEIDALGKEAADYNKFKQEQEKDTAPETVTHLDVPVEETKDAQPTVQIVK